MTAATVEPIGRRGHHRDALVELTLLAAGGALAGGLGWILARAGMLGAIAGVGALSFAVLFVLVRERTLLTLATLVFSLVVLLHKSLGPIADRISGGPPSTYVTTFDVVLVVLYGLWLAEGSILRDLTRAFRSPALWAPLVGMILSSASILVAGHLPLAFAELSRMAWLYVLFVYVAARIRRRAEVWVLLGALAGVALVQLVVVTLQWRTGGVLGLSFLGVPTQLNERVLDEGLLGRPFGTIIHPVFLGAFVGVVALMALSLSVHLRRRSARLLWLGIAGAAVAPMLLARTRAAAAAFALCFFGIVAVGVVRRHLSRRVVVWGAIALGVLALALSPQISRQVADNFGSDHFGTEIESRWELNEVAVTMIEDQPLLGVGLNNFQQEMGRYDTYGLIFGGNPVHNLYLLHLAETGLVGLLGMLVVVTPLVFVASQLARERDPLFRSVGVGAMAMYAFFAVEELLGFSLRQDVPRTVFWLIAGLTIACLRMARPDWDPMARLLRRRGARPVRDSGGSDGAWPHAGERPGSPPPRPQHAGSGWTGGHAAAIGGRLRDRGRTRRRIIPLILAGLTPGALAVVAIPASAGDGPRVPATLQPFEGSALVFSAWDRGTGRSAIYTSTLDGTAPTRITPADDLDWSWSKWAFGGSKIIASARRGTTENLFLMNPDGSDLVALTESSWRNAQPSVSPDGTWVLFSSLWEEFPFSGIFRIDLETLEVQNLSARHDTAGGIDADPRFSPDGEQIVFATSASPTGTVPTQIWTMATDGSDRAPLTRDAFYNTDPDISPDGRTVAYSSYRGEGHPGVGALDGSLDVDDIRDTLQVTLQDWFLVLKDRETGSETVLNQGLPCYRRLAPAPPCTAQESAAWAPQWSADGAAIAYIGIRDASNVCICAINRDGSGADALFSSDELVVTWFDIRVHDGSVIGDASAVGTRRPVSGLLVLGSRDDGDGKTPFVAASTPDGWRARALPINAALEPSSARWSRDRSKIVFTARVPYDADRFAPWPPPPPGAPVVEHFTLDRLSPVFAPVIQRPELAEQQVFLLDLRTGNLRQLTDPWIEDYRDGLVMGDARGNHDADISPDGRFVAFTNTSALTLESFVLRLDLETGEVLNLTNATAGAVPVGDSGPRFSPGGDRVAFASGVDHISQIWVMDTDGSNAISVTDDDAFNTAPAWSPDGRHLAFARYVGDELGVVGEDSLAAAAAASRVPLDDWELVTLDLDSGHTTVLTPPSTSPILSPVWSPDGDRVAFVSTSAPGQPDIYTINADGTGLRPVQVTLLSHELGIDWR